MTYFLIYFTKFPLYFVYFATKIVSFITLISLLMFTLAEGNVKVIAQGLQQHNPKAPWLINICCYTFRCCCGCSFLLLLLLFLVSLLLLLWQQLLHSLGKTLWPKQCCQLTQLNSSWSSCRRRRQRVVPSKLITHTTHTDTQQSMYVRPFSRHYFNSSVFSASSFLPFLRARLASLSNHEYFLLLCIVIPLNWN